MPQPDCFRRDQDVVFDILKYSNSLAALRIGSLCAQVSKNGWERLSCTQMMSATSQFAARRNARVSGEFVSIAMTMSLNGNRRSFAV